VTLAVTGNAAPCIAAPHACSRGREHSRAEGPLAQPGHVRRAAWPGCGARRPLGHKPTSLWPSN